jgi:pimeloyl-ACP methyl ester carboxylesterase
MNSSRNRGHNIGGSTATSRQTVTLGDIGPVDVSVVEHGEGRLFVLLHGGGGPDTVAGFAELLATAHPARTITPTHPGFGGTPRPDALHTIGALAEVYVALLDQLDLNDVTVVGNSIGGWIAAEMALLGSSRITGVILIDAVGIEVPGHPVADFFSLTLDQVFQLSFHNPNPFRIDPTSLPPAAQRAAAGNRDALAVYAGTSMSDPGLAERLATARTPTLVLWGDSDQIVDAHYGRAYAAAIPTARFHLLTDTGHMPQVETPDQVLQAIRDDLGLLLQPGWHPPASE